MTDTDLRRASASASARVSTFSATVGSEKNVARSRRARTLPKTLAANRLVNAVRFMAMGEQYAPIDFMTTASEEAPANTLAPKLSPRELQMLRGLCEGKANKEITRDLGIQEPTVKLHMKTLYRKITASNRTQAAMIARDTGLF